MWLAEWFPVDVEGAVVPLVSASLVAVVLPPTYVWWGCAAQAIVGAGYVFSRRRRAARPWAYVVLHVGVLAVLVAGVIVIRRVWQYPN